MGDRSNIEWTDATWNPLAAFDKETGKRGWFCTKVSPGCKHCYAEALNKRLGTGHAYAVPNLEEVDFRLVNVDQPLRWKRPRRVFVNSMTDLFHEAVDHQDIAKVFSVMAGASRHTFQVLTKRTDRMADLLSSPMFWAAVWVHGMEWAWDDETLATLGEIGPSKPVPNIWLGTSVEDQERANERIPHLLRTPAAVRFLSCEPLLGPVDLTGIYLDAMHEAHAIPCIADGVAWVIVGGESGPGARWMHVPWVRDLLGQCERWHCPIFVKQLGSMPADINTLLCHQPENPHTWPEDTVVPKEYTPEWQGQLAPIRLRDKKGGDMDEWPEGLRVREYPGKAQ